MPPAASVSSDHCLECREYRGFFLGHRWTEIPLDKLWSNREALPFLRDEAFCYYLPCFLLASLEVKNFQDHPSSDAEEYADAILSVLAPPTDGEGSTWRGRIAYDGFSSDQRRLLRRYLDFRRTHCYTEDPRVSGCLSALGGG
jgi:hypothetical protein